MGRRSEDCLRAQMFLSLLRPVTAGRDFFVARCYNCALLYAATPLSMTSFLFPPSSLMISARRTCSLALLAAFAVGLIGCGGPSDASPSAEGASALTDASYLTGAPWNDGAAEVAFYDVQRTVDQAGQPSDQHFTMGTYLVKHNFDPQVMSKATDGGGVPAFKYAQFFEFESGSYQYKRSHVTNVRQRDLHPLKYSFTNFDWCSNLYREQAFSPDGTVHYLERSDDYGNDEGAYDYRAQAYPAAQLPLLVRGIAFSASQPTRSFSVIHPNGTYTSAEAERLGTEQVQTPGGPVEAEKIAVRYDAPVPTPLAGGPSDTLETYWRGTGPQRALVKVAAGSGRYQMALVEKVRSPYWKEDVYDQLQRVQTRP